MSLVPLALLPCRFHSTRHMNMLSSALLRPARLSVRLQFRRLRGLLRGWYGFCPQRPQPELAGRPAGMLLSALIHRGIQVLCMQRGYQGEDFGGSIRCAPGTGPMLSSIGAFIVLAKRRSRARHIGLIAVWPGSD